MKDRSAGKYSKSRKEYETQVFLSFRGPDTRTFVGHLFNGLQSKGFRVFLDSKRLEPGTDIQVKLYEAIDQSNTSVVILSRRYADSEWCLDELVRIMKRQRDKVHSVLPVFFDVEPNVVRHQKEVYMDAFKVLESQFADEMDRVENWRSALKQVAALAGVSLGSYRDASELVNAIIEKLRKIINTSMLYVSPCIVGRDLILEEISTWLQDGSSDVEVGLIYGLGGIGKSTIAKIAYNNNAIMFDGSSFLEKFTAQILQPDGLARLLEQVIFDVTGEPGNKIYNVDKGMNDVGAVLCSRRVLIVLDDVDELENLHYAFKDQNIFGEGSKIIITSRNEELSKVSLFKRKFLISWLEPTESKDALKLYASIGKVALSQYQEDLLDKFLEHCQGLPLALYTLGPLIQGETEQKWEDLLDHLERYPDNKILSVFRLSFDCINDDYTKELFLYISCFFVGMDKSYTLTVLEGCELRAKSGLLNLISRCLVAVDDHDNLMVHERIEEMGKEIARKEAINEPGRRSKIWRYEDSISVLKENQGTSIVRGLRLDAPKPNVHSESHHHNCENSEKFIHSSLRFGNLWRYLSTMKLMSIGTSAFASMPNLKLLVLNNIQLDGGYEGFPKNLKWLSWHGCPLSLIPSNFNLDEIVVLDMQKSCLVHAWGASKHMGALKILDLSYSNQLVCTPDLSCAFMLECLFLKGCVRLLEVHESVGILKNLKHLNVAGCESLVKVHRSIENLKKLTILNLKGCKILRCFPIPTSVVQLNLAQCSNFITTPNKVEPLVTSASYMSRILSMASSLLQYRIPASPVFRFELYLPALKDLNLARCGVSREDILNWLNVLPSLRCLDLSHNPICPPGMRPMRFYYLNSRGCTKLGCSVSQLTRGSDIPTLSLPRGREVNVEFHSSMKSFTFISTKAASPLDATTTDGCHELLEVDYGGNGGLVFKLTRDMDKEQVNVLAFTYQAKSLNTKVVRIKWNYRKLELERIRFALLGISYQFPLDLEGSSSWPFDNWFLTKEPVGDHFTWMEEECDSLLLDPPYWEEDVFLAKLAITLEDPNIVKSRRSSAELFNLLRGVLLEQERGAVTKLIERTLTPYYLPVGAMFINPFLEGFVEGLLRHEMELGEGSSHSFLKFGELCRFSKATCDWPRKTENVGSKVTKPWILVFKKRNKTFTKFEEFWTECGTKIQWKLVYRKRKIKRSKNGNLPKHYLRKKELDRRSISWIRATWRDYL